MNRFLSVIALFVLTLTGADAQLRATARVHVTGFHFEGNTVFTAAQLTAVIAQHIGKDATRDDLEEARRALTLHYVQAGYINSGAILPDQPVKSGVITFRIIEGRLTRVILTGNHWLRSGTITNRLTRWDGPPLNMNELRDGLQRLRQDPNIEQVNAELRPDFAPGESVLDLRVQYRQPFHVGLQLDNARPPSVDSTEILGLLADRNLTGHSDTLEATYGIAQGGARGYRFSDWDNVSASYTVPLTIWDTTLRGFGDTKNYAVVEAPFDVLHINSESTRYGAQLRQPVWQRANHEVALAVSFERRQSDTRLLGKPFDFPESGSVSGRTSVSVLRVTQEWNDRGLQQVLSFRSTISVGLNVFSATDDGTDWDGKFVAWLGQAQYIRRLFNTQNQLILRTDGQWSDGKLLSLEQFSVGGINSVRGYRENQLVRDRGVFGSVELRLPVLLNKLGAPVVQLAPFFDGGAGHNVGIARTDTLLSAGLGVLLTPCSHVNAALYWGYAFKDFKTQNNDPQDLGLSFRLTIDALAARFSGPVISTLTCRRV